MGAIRRARMERAWVVLTVGWGLFRVIVVWRLLAPYGVNPWVYLGIEAATSAPYGIATSRVVTNLIDGRLRLAHRYAIAAAALFLAPDLYLIASGHSMPAYVYVVIVVLVITLGSLSIVGIIAKANEGRRERMALAAAGRQARREMRSPTI